MGSKAAGGRCKAMRKDPSHDAAYNRDHDQKPGSPQRAATEPKGSEGSAKSRKTLTDPQSGGGQKAGHAPNQAKTDQSDGAGRARR
jgi:hypothetical protein